MSNKAETAANPLLGMKENNEEIQREKKVLSEFGKQSSQFQA